MQNYFTERHLEKVAAKCQPLCSSPNILTHFNQILIKKNIAIIIEENEFKYVVYKMAAICLGLGGLIEN